MQLKMLLTYFLALFIFEYDVKGYATINLDDQSATEEELPYKHCVCVPFWQCRDSLSGTDGVLSILDTKNKITEDKGPLACTGYYDVCCQVQCGIRESVIHVSDKFENKILGEHNTADFGEFPWMLGILQGKKYKCGGSLIHPKVALTAAHCVLARANYTVRAGEWHWGQTSEPLLHQNREVKDIIIHPQFHASSLKNDIALLILKVPFKLTKNVGIVCLPPRTLKVDVQRCIATGWGKNSFKKDTYESVLKKVDLPLIPKQKCTAVLRETTLGPLFTLHGSFICAGGEYNKDTCKGDGGGPLICPVIGKYDRYEQVGIVSWGFTCGQANTPGVYVNVVIFMDWIDSEMFKLNLDTDIYRY